MVAKSGRLSENTKHWQQEKKKMAMKARQPLPPELRSPSPPPAMLAKQQDMDFDAPY